MHHNVIPVADPRSQVLILKEKILERINKVLLRGQYILGEEVKNFEKEFAQYIGIEYCIGLASGTDALSLALKSIDVVPGDEVITVSHSAVATVAAIEQIGAVPVFADIDPITRCMDHQKILPLISKKTKAILPVHIYGQPCSIEDIRSIAEKNNIKIVEDCAQAHGAEINGKKVGTFGHVAAFSFYPTKNLGALGDGGAVVTNAPEIAEKIRWLREYGWKERYISSIPGVNSRLDEIQAAILCIKLPFLPQNNQRRLKIAEEYCKVIDGEHIKPPVFIKGTTHAMHLFVVECEKRSSLQKYLNDKGISTAIHYPKPIHQQQAYLGRIRGGDDLPCTEELYKKILSLPMYPELSDMEVQRICSALSEWQLIQNK